MNTCKLRFAYEYLTQGSQGHKNLGKIFLFTYDLIWIIYMISNLLSALASRL